MPRSAYTPLNRKHVRLASRWAYEAGTDYWLIPGPAISSAADTASQEQLAEWGWTATALTDTVGAGADFMSSSDRAPNHILTNASSDLLSSPAIFGDYDHAWQAMKVAGQRKMPTDLILECMASFTVASNDDQGSGFGFVEDGGSPIVEADHLGFIASDGTNFQLAADGGSGVLTDAGAAVDTSWNLWKIRINLADQLIYWYINGTLQGSVAVTADEFPAKFGMGVEAGSTGNRIGLGIVHIYYDW